MSLHRGVVRASRDGAVSGDVFNSVACAASLVKIVYLHAVRFAICNHVSHWKVKYEGSSSEFERQGPL